MKKIIVSANTMKKIIVFGKHYDTHLDLHLVFFYAKLKFRTEGQRDIRALPNSSMNFFIVFTTK